MKPRTATAEHINQKTAESGWFRDALFTLDSMIFGRWSYWCDILEAGTIGDQPIPRIDFGMIGESNRDHSKWRCADMPAAVAELGNMAAAKQNCERCFQDAFRAGASLSDVAEWWLWAFGSRKIAARPELPESAARAMYCGLELHRMMAHPADWAAHVATLYYGDKGGRHCAWFPTPMSICNLMAAMTYGEHEGDTRALSVNDPCIGTGAMLLPVSNYSLNLSGQDVDRTMCLLCEWQAWLFVPWLAISGHGRVVEFGNAERSEETGVSDNRSPDLDSSVDPGILGLHAAIACDGLMGSGEGSRTTESNQADGSGSSGRASKPKRRPRSKALTADDQRLLFSDQT